MTLRTSELTRIRGAHADWLDQTASSITRPDGGKTADGWPDATGTTVASSVACRCEPDATRGNEGSAASGVVALERWKVIFGHGVAALKPMDVIVVTSVGTFDVEAVTTGRGVNTHVVASCTRREAV